ncbi:MAG: hypothetical protein AAF432_16775 [Planctomycetota bacterium]
MLFQTYEFLILMLAVMVGIACIRNRRQQHMMLLFASYVFYGWWDVRFLMLIVLSTTIDYAAALGMDGIKLSHKRRAMISAVILGSIALFLVPNWPALQNGVTLDSIGAFFVPSWTGAVGAIGACAVFAIIGPLLYGVIFDLPEARRRKLFMLISVMANLGLLGFFKYFNFFTDSVVGLASLMDVDIPRTTLNILLPVGISFYTFQTLSYTIDV